MNRLLTERLNKIRPKLISDDFLNGSGIGNEIAFYIFDYPPEDELLVREHIEFLVDDIPKGKPGLRIKHVNLLDFIISYLNDRNLLDRSFKKQREHGDEALLKALQAPLHGSKLVQYFAEIAPPADYDLFLVSGVGSAWPLLRSHSLLNNLHAVMDQTPLVLFYPGCYDGQSLRLFGILENKNYYRAFKLVP